MIRREFTIMLMVHSWCIEVSLLLTLFIRILLVRFMNNLPLRILGTPPTRTLTPVGLATVLNPVLIMRPFLLAIIGLVPCMVTCKRGLLFTLCNRLTIRWQVFGMILIGRVKPDLRILSSPLMLMMIRNCLVWSLMSPLWARYVLFFPTRPPVGLILLVLLTVRLTRLTLPNATSGTLHLEVSRVVRNDAGIFPTLRRLLVC